MLTDYVSSPVSMWAYISGRVHVCAGQDCACTQQTFLQHPVHAEDVAVTKTVLALSSQGSVQ